MIELDEDALICDLAETYQIYDYGSLPLKTVATLAAGLRENSRIMLKASGAKASQETILLAMIADRIEAFRYSFTEDASKRRNPPVSIAELFLDAEKQGETASFSNAEQFEAALAKIRGEL